MLMAELMGLMVFEWIVLMPCFLLVLHGNGAAFEIQVVFAVRVRLVPCTSYNAKKFKTRSIRMFSFWGV